jgi:Protein of unknown function (DUF2652)
VRAVYDRAIDIPAGSSMSGPITMGAASGLFLLADISGYTSFLQAVGTAHGDDPIDYDDIPPAYPLMSSLLDGIIERVAPPFTLSKLEGDAVFAFAVDADEMPRADAMLAFLGACYAAFRTHLTALEQALTCTCDACSRGAALDLKFILHAGRFVMQSIGGGRELVGSDVVMAHRLLKNGGAAAIGRPAYVLITDAAVARLDIPVAGATSVTETYDHYAPIEVAVFPLG